MDKEQAESFRRRWQAVAAVEREEQRRATVEERWRQLNALLLLCRNQGITPDHDSAAEVTRRWARLKNGSR